MSEMPVPEWANETRSKMFEAHSKFGYDKTGVKPKDLTPVTSFSTHFAEWEIRGDDLLVHVFPRGGESDRWYPEEYRDGKYIPARREEKIDGLKFPENMLELIKKATDEVWNGDVAVEKVPELEAYVIQFQQVRLPLRAMGYERFMDRFCEVIDKALER